MAFRSVGTNLSGLYADGVRGLAEDLEALERAGPDFVEIWPQNLGVILGGRLDTNRLRAIEGLLLEAELNYTVHAPLEVNLMDLTSHGLQRDVLDAGLRFAKGIGAGVVVCHAGQRLGAREARYSMGDQLSSERSALREAGTWRENSALPSPSRTTTLSCPSSAARSTTTPSGPPSWPSRSRP